MIQYAVCAVLGVAASIVIVDIVYKISTGVEFAPELLLLAILLVGMEWSSKAI